MEPTRFDSLTRVLGDGRRHAPSRRALLALLGGGLVATAAPALDTAAKRKKKHKKHKHRHGGGGGGGTLGLREICEPGSNSCKSGLDCDAPTLHHTCSDTVSGIDAWCCVPAGSPCSRDIDECECCAGSYCEYGDNNEPHCLPDPDA